MKLCHLYVNSPDHAFDEGLAAEALRVCDELSLGGFPIRAVVRHAGGDERVQWQQIEADRRAEPAPDLCVIIPVNQDAVYRIVSEILSTRRDTTCVLLHQPLSRMLASEKEAHHPRLFSVSADQVEIGRLQARQFAALLPSGGALLYVQGREHSFATRHRSKGLLEELARTPELTLNGYRVHGDWSSESVASAVESWAASGGRLEWIQAAGAQNDDMAIALADLARERGLSLPVIGVDGMETGRTAVARGRLAATVLQPLGVGHAIRVFRHLTNGAAGDALIPADGNILLSPESLPSLEALRSARTS